MTDDLQAAAMDMDVLAGIPDTPAPAPTIGNSAPAQAMPVESRVPEGFHPQYFAGGSLTPNPDDNTLIVKFYHKLGKNKAKDPLNPAHRELPDLAEREYVSIQVPGSKDSAAHPVSRRDIERFPNHYRAFKERVAPPENGTPLASWPGITSNMTDELSFAGIKTVEQLAALTDTNAQRFRGIIQVRQKAREYVDQAKGRVELEKAAVERDDLRRQNEELQRKMAAMEKRLDALSAEDAAPKPARRAKKEG